jgi:hypothetical protein
VLGERCGEGEVEKARDKVERSGIPPEVAAVLLMYVQGTDVSRRVIAEVLRRVVGRELIRGLTVRVGPDVVIEE